MDVTSDNIVVVLHKAEGGEGSRWTSFSVGPTAAEASVSDTAVEGRACCIV